MKGPQEGRCTEEEVLTYFESDHNSTFCNISPVFPCSVTFILAKNTSINEITIHLSFFRNLQSYVIFILMSFKSKYLSPVVCKASTEISAILIGHVVPSPFVSRQCSLGSVLVAPGFNSCKDNHILSLSFSFK